MPDIQDKQEGKCGKIAKSEAHNLFERLRRYESFVLFFAKKSAVSFTNNKAKEIYEWQKLSKKYQVVLEHNFMQKLIVGF